MNSRLHQSLIICTAVLLSTLSFYLHASANPLLYEAKKQEQTILLLGTIHAGKEDFYPLPDAILERLAQSDRLVMETNPDDLNSPTPPEQIQKYFMHSPPTPLNQRVSPQLYKRLSLKLQQLNLAEAHLLPLRNWAIVMQITMAQVQRLGLKTSYGVDLYFAKQAREMGLRIDALESVEFQLEILASLDDMDAEVLYQNTLDELAMADQYLTNLEAAWRTGNSKELVKLYSDYAIYNEQQVFMQRLTEQRNQNWVRWIRQQRPELKLFFVVGDMHLHGPGSVLDMLKQAGYQVKSLSSD